MSKRILLISSRADHGGGPRHIELLLQELKEDYEFYIACPEEPPYWGRFRKIVGNRIFRLPHRKISFRSVIALYRYVKENSIDLIHSHGKGAGFYAKIIKRVSKRNWIHTPHGIHIDHYNWLTKNFYRIYENNFMSIPDKIFFVSEEERKKSHLENIWQDIPFEVIPNGVPVKLPDDMKILRPYGRSLLGFTDQVKIVLSISRFDYQKNMYEAFLIAQKLPEIMFVWIGNGPDRKILENEIHKKGLKNIKIIEFCDDPMPYLASADIYLSTSRWEGLPLSILESMSLGIPIVASEVVGHKEIVEDNQSGVLYSLGDPSKAVNKIKYLLENKRVLTFYKESAMRRQNKNYSTLNMGKIISNNYNLILVKN